MHLVLYTGHRLIQLTPWLSWPLLIGAAWGFVGFLRSALAFVRELARSGPPADDDPAVRFQRSHN